MCVSCWVFVYVSVCVLGASEGVSLRVHVCECVRLGKCVRLCV